MIGRPLDGGPLRLGDVLDSFHVAAARSNGPPEPLFSRGLSYGGEEHAKNALLQPSPDRACPDPSHVPTRQRQWRSVTFKLNQLSLACPVKRAQPPWTVDDKALRP
jgi:hypothetical protein